MSASRTTSCAVSTSVAKGKAVASSFETPPELVLGFAFGKIRGVV